MKQGLAGKVVICLFSLVLALEEITKQQTKQQHWQRKPLSS
jgi:hypothetical protein